MSGHILIATADSADRSALRALLEGQGYSLETVATTSEALAHLDGERCDLLLCDAATEKVAGYQIVRQIRRASLPLEVILLGGYGSLDGAREGIQAGAFDLLKRPILDEELLLSVRRALEAGQLRSENNDLRERLASLNGFFGAETVTRDAATLKALEAVDAVAPTRAAVLLSGESGTGKSHVARRIHDSSDRVAAPFLEVRCGALPDALLEESLFGNGSERAPSARNGAVAAAEGGTLFLDHVEALPPALQRRLHTELREPIARPGADRERALPNVRVIAATRENLPSRVEAGEFRRDLYYRISVVPIHLPALRERPADIPLLAGHLLRRFAAQNRKHIASIDDDALTILQSHRWPGNLRELESVMERAVIVCRGPALAPSDLPAELSQSIHAPDPGQTLPLKKALEVPERQIIESTLRSHNWNRQETAAALMINRTTLFNKMRKYGLLTTTRSRPS